MAIAGLALSSLLHVVAAMLGLAVLSSQSPLAYTLLEIVGASYLVYLGLEHFGIQFFGENNKNESEDSEVTEEKLGDRDGKIFV